MAAEKESKRDYDSRATKARNLIAELLKLGAQPPLTVEIDGLRIEVGSYKDPAPQPTVGNLGVLAQAELATQAQVANVRSYRQRAREDLTRRIREAEESKS